MTGKYQKKILENMRDVFMAFIECNKGKNDKQSTIEKMVLVNNIKLIDTEMQRRDHLNITGSECEVLKTTSVEKE